MDKLLSGKNVLLKHVPQTHQDTLKVYDKQGLKSYQVILDFVYSLEEMKRAIRENSELLEEEGILYVCYPKLKNKLGLTGIHRDHLFSYLGVDEKTGYVNHSLMRFNKMLALDDDYTILGIKKDAKLKKRSDTSMHAEDYEIYIPDLKTYLMDKPCYAFFVNLTPGYQKGWSRYIYSAKTNETKHKRLLEMVDLLNQGVKSKDLIKKG